MSTNYCAWHYKEWQEAGLRDYCEFSDMVEYINCGEDGFSGFGEWFFNDDETLTIYYGSYGNYNSPGASSYTFADVYDCPEEYAKEVKRLESFDEFLPCEESEAN